MATKIIPPTSRVEILANSGLCSIPAEFVRAESERKDIVDALNNGAIGHGIPIVDLGGISSEEGRWRCVEEVKAEATEWGVMLIVNHGVQDEIIERLQASGRGFFDLPVEAKEKHANDQSSGQIQGYGSKLANNANGKLEWQGYFFHLVYPKEKADLDIWPTEPADYMKPGHLRSNCPNLKTHPIKENFEEKISFKKGKKQKLKAFWEDSASDSLE